ncbi:Lovastatin diketide synthase LovF [Metarhizium anisopliae]
MPLAHSLAGLGPGSHLSVQRRHPLSDEWKGPHGMVNALGGELLIDTQALAARFGRVVEIDKKAALQNNSLPMGTFKKNVSLSSVDFRGLFQHKPEEVRDVFGQVVRLQCTTSLFLSNLCRFYQFLRFPEI